MGFLKSLMSVISTDGKTGTPFKVDKNHTMYYKGDGVTKLDAARVAGFFEGYGYFTETSECDIQIASEKPGDPVQVGYIVGTSDLSSETKDYFKDAVAGLQELFPGREVSCRLLDVNFKHLSSL
jgi:hypothetical protein